MARATPRPFVATLALCSLFFAAVLVATAQDDLREQEGKLLKGAWKMIWTIDDGQKRQPDDQVANQNLTFYPKKGVIASADFGDVKFTFDPGKNPREMDIWWQGEKVRPDKFIYQVKGDELWLAWGSQDQRPASFAAKKYQILIYKRK